jgi:hypothetical protein
MEKRFMGIFLQVCVVAMAFGYTAITANAQLLNGGFESGTPPNPDNWTTFNGAVSVATNDVNAAAITAHSGVNSLKTFGPFGPGPDLDASGAFQDITTGFSAGETWVFTGYALNWSGDPLAGSNGFGLAQVIFLTGTNILQTSGSVHYGTDVSMPQDVWQHFMVSATVPVGADTMRLYVLHVGMVDNTGSVWWDDLELYKRTGQTSTNSVTTQPGVQISWPTFVGVNTQVQTTPSLSTNTIWTNFGPVWGTGGTNRISDVIGATQSKFYKVIKAP